MKPLSSLLRPTVAVLILIAALAIAALHTGQAAATHDVLVTNSGAAQAVPVSYPTTPTVNVGNTPTVNLGSGNTVGINGPVQVDNTATSPVLVRDVDNPARRRFQVGAACNLNPSCLVTFTVPSGKLLVIETVSLQEDLTIGLKARTAQLHTVVGSVDGFYSLPFQPTGTFLGLDEFRAIHFVRLYADPGTTVGVNFGTNVFTSGGSAGVTISGYLVDCGTGTGCPLP